MITAEQKIRYGLKEENNVVVKTSFVTMMKFYSIYDMLYGTRHTEVLHTLYEGDKLYTLDGVALRCHISRRTLDRNRQEYLTCFNICENVSFSFDEVAVTTK